MIYCKGESRGRSLWMLQSGCHAFSESMLQNQYDHDDDASKISILWYLVDHPPTHLEWQGPPRLDLQYLNLCLTIYSPTPVVVAGGNVGEGTNNLSM